MRALDVRVVRHSGASPGARAGTRPTPERSGLLLLLTLPGGVTAQGEASPLPGYSGESLEDAERALGRIDWTRLPELDGSVSTEAVFDAIEGAVDRACPSARFAVETALLDALGQRRGQPLWALLDPSTPDPPRVPLCAYAGAATDPGVLDRAAAAVRRGVTTVKVKITGPRLGAQMDSLARVRSTIGGVALRLDANQSLAPETARADLERLARLEPELVEEPVPPTALDAWESSPIPIALDESLKDPAVWARLAPRAEALGIRAVVLKPMALGGFAACRRIAEGAKRRGLEATISHLFDGPVALTAAAHLALALGSRSRASGLDVHAGLDAWPRVPLPSFSATSILPDTQPGLGLDPLPEPAKGRP